MLHFHRDSAKTLTKKGRFSKGNIVNFLELIASFVTSSLKQIFLFGFHISKNFRFHMTRILSLLFALACFIKLVHPAPSQVFLMLPAMIQKIIIQKTL